jgi:hypothetical protein
MYTTIEVSQYITPMFNQPYILSTQRVPNMPTLFFSQTGVSLFKFDTKAKNKYVAFNFFYQGKHLNRTILAECMHESPTVNKEWNFQLRHNSIYDVPTD